LAARRAVTLILAAQRDQQGGGQERPNAGAGRLDSGQSDRIADRVPILYKIPVLGALFGNTSELLDRTELIVLITPQVVENSQEADQVTEEIKRKMREIAPMVPAS
jgi:general secretion pathway protein D